LYLNFFIFDFFLKVIFFKIFLKIYFFCFKKDFFLFRIYFYIKKVFLNFILKIVFSQLNTFNILVVFSDLFFIGKSFLVFIIIKKLLFFEKLKNLPIHYSLLPSSSLEKNYDV
jgi:hypothetical protein